MFNTLFDPVSLDMLYRLFFSAFLGVLIGIERSVVANKRAGMRTYALIAMGSTAFIIISQHVTTQYLGQTMFDPLRVASQIIVGIGFVGGGMIVFQDNKLSGLTTAAGLWVTAAIGMAVGFHMYEMAMYVAVGVLFIFDILWHAETKLKHLMVKWHRHDKDGDKDEV